MTRPTMPLSFLIDNERARQSDFEKRLASLVEDAYGLTAEERVLLRSTRPIRDPIDVLEAKIRGTAEPTVETNHPG
jgi:hypothetical protein